MHDLIEIVLLLYGIDNGSIAGERDLGAAVGVGQVRFDLDQQIFQVTLEGRYGFGTVLQVLLQSVEGFG